MSCPLRIATVTVQLPSRSACLQRLQDGEIGGRLGNSPLFCERVLEAAEVAGGVAHVRLADLDGMQPHHGIDNDRMLFRAFPHDLAVHLAFRRHVDDEVAANLRLAAEASARWKSAASFDVALFDLAPRACVALVQIRGRAWRRRLRRRQPGSGRKSHARRRPNRGRRRAGGRRRARSVPSAKAPRLPDGVKTTRCSVTPASRLGAAARARSQERRNMPKSGEAADVG